MRSTTAPWPKACRAWPITCSNSIATRQSLRRLRCVVAYDTRHRSREFAELAASIMVGNGFEVFFFDQIRPTPELSFAVRDLGCACGTMISASHNPPSDNAIKPFWSTGGQLKLPHDEATIVCVGKVTAIKRVPFAEAVASGRVKFCQEQIDPRYRAAVLAQGQQGPRDIKILYSPLHGVGLTSVLPILQMDGFKNVEVYEPHSKPDGDFPNVPNNIANPENPAVFDKPIEHARTSGAEIILASDPDADRIGCAAPLTAGSKEWRTLSGNQIGVLLGELLLRRRQAAGTLTPENYVIKTLVTSDMICRVAEKFGCRYYGDVLTGFKWIGSVIDEVGPEKFVFGYEEAHGYLAGTYARDKDGAVAALLMAELAAECKAQGITLHEHLDKVYLQYGCHLEKTINITLPGASGVAQMKAIMERLRTSPPAKLGGLAGRSSARLLETASAEIRQLEQPGRQSAPERSADLRSRSRRQPRRRAPSGTEPKIKFYLFASEYAGEVARSGGHEEAT